VTTNFAKVERVQLYLEKDRTFLLKGELDKAQAEKEFLE
jgi:hypothetical protein